MSVKVEASHGGIPHGKIAAAGIIIALVSLYIAALGHEVLGFDYFAFFGGIAAIGALIWGNSAIKRLCSYGIGAGVPSAGMLAFGSGLFGMFLGTIIGAITCVWIIPVAVLVIALITGLILGWIANTVLNMKIPVMVQSLAELAAVGALTVLGLRTVATGCLGAGAGEFSFVTFGFIAVAFMLGAIALQHPFNACLGPGETQDRTNMLVVECGFLSMIVMGVISFVAVSAIAGWITILVAFIGWAVSYKKYIALSKRDAAAWLDAKPFVDAEEE